MRCQSVEDLLYHWRVAYRMSRSQPHRGCGSAERFYRPPPDEMQRYAAAHIEPNKELAYLCEKLVNTKVSDVSRVILVCVCFESCGSVAKMDYALNRRLRQRRCNLKIEEQFQAWETAKRELWQKYEEYIQSRLPTG